MEHIRKNILKSFGIKSTYKDTYHNRRIGRVGQEYGKDNQVYFQSYGAAIDDAHRVVSESFKIDDEEWFNQMGSGGKPSSGQTKKGTITLYDKKTGKEQKRALAIQVYNMERDHNSFELNWYIN